MRHIPNLLSGLRIVIIPFFVWQALAGNTLQAAALLALSGVTDMLDGGLARRFGWITQLGKVLDPVADKLTQVTVCVVLAYSMRQYWPFFAILLFKELVMLALGGYLVKKDVKIEGAKWFGKVVTVLFYVVMVALMCFPGMPVWLRVMLLSVVSVAAVVAGCLYLPAFFSYLRGARGEEA